MKNPPGRKRIAWSLVTLTGLTEARAIARRLDINYVTAWTWSTGGVRLLIARLLLVCAKLGVATAEFLTSEAFAPSSTDVEVPLVPAKPVTLKQRVSNKCHMRRLQNAKLLRRARNYLEFAMEEDVSPPPTLQKVCREGGFTKPYLYRHFPDLCRQISARWMVWTKRVVLPAVIVWPMRFAV